MPLVDERDVSTNSEETIHKGFAAAREWCAYVRLVGLEEARKQARSPLSGSSVSWAGGERVSWEEPILFDILHMYGGAKPVAMRLIGRAHSITLSWAGGATISRRIRDEPDLAAIGEILESKDFRELEQRPITTSYMDERAIVAAHGLKTIVRADSAQPIAKSLFIHLDSLFAKAFGEKYVRPFLSE